MYVQERFHGVALAANGSWTTAGNAIGGFLGTIAGTLTVTTRTGVVLVNAVPVSAGVFTPIPLLTGTDAVVQLAGGAAGTLFK